jgi:hypothetical protein
MRVIVDDENVEGDVVSDTLHSVVQQQCRVVGGSMTVVYRKVQRAGRCINFG